MIRHPEPRPRSSAPSAGGVRARATLTILAGLLRDAAAFPLDGGVAVVSVRAAAAALQRGNDRAH